jgi:NodT family efflux transporter outer membrane factor (OMF) lipoprotein
MSNQWWTAFGDAELNWQIERSLNGNYTLAAAWERLIAAEALTRREASDLWPDVDGVAEAAGVFRSHGREESLFAMGLEASYEVDLWGRIGSRVEAERLRASARFEDYHATALTLSAEVARVWFTLIEAHAQLALLEEQIKTNLTALELQEDRFALGQIRSPDVLRQRQLVESTREQAVVVRSRIELLEHLLAVLQGEAAQAVGYEVQPVLPDLPPLPNTGLPGALITRRPDVLRDFLALQAADYDVASAVSNLYPRLNLSASAITAAESPENLFREWIASVAGQLIGPLLDGGQRRAEVDRTNAVVRERLADYSQTVLNAFREVEDALARERYQLDRIGLLESQLGLARMNSTQLREQYLIREVDYLDVLSAITEEQRLQRAVLSARLELLLIRVGLYVALAGDLESNPRDASVDCLPGALLDDE